MLPACAAPDKLLPRAGRVQLGKACPGLAQIRCPMAAHLRVWGIGNELAESPSRGRIMETANDGCQQRNIWEMSNRIPTRGLLVTLVLWVPCGCLPRGVAATQAAARSDKTFRVTYQVQLIGSKPGGKTAEALMRQLDMTLTATVGKKAGHAAIDFRVDRAVARDIFEGKTVGSFDTRRRPIVEGQGTGFDHILSYMTSGRFTAQVDGAGGIVSFHMKGANRDLLLRCRQEKEALRDENADEGADAREQREMLARYRRQLQREILGRHRRVLSDLLAYMPPQPDRVGQAWQVKRTGLYQVFPMLGYGVYMLTGAGPCLSETASCRLEAIEPSPGGRIGVIRIRARRDAVIGPQYQESATGVYFDCEGQLRFNLETRCLVGQRIENTVRFLPGEDAGGSFKLIETITQTPVTVPN